MLAGQLALLAGAVAELRRCQQHAAQAAAARAAAERLQEARDQAVTPAGRRPDKVAGFWLTVPEQPVADGRRQPNVSSFGGARPEDPERGRRALTFRAS